METMVVCSAMDLIKEEESEKGTQSTKGSWANWKHGGTIGAAALTGGALMAITGGMVPFTFLDCLCIWTYSKKKLSFFLVKANKFL